MRYSMSTGAESSAINPAMTTIQCKDGITYKVISAKPYIHNGSARISYTCKRPRGKRTYLVIGYANGLFSTAA